MSKDTAVIPGKKDRRKENYALLSCRIISIPTLIRIIIN